MSRERQSEPTTLLALRVKTARAFSGLTLRELGERCQCSNAFLCQVEGGQSDIGSVRLARLARALNISADWLIGLTDEPKSLRRDRAGRGT